MEPPLPTGAPQGTANDRANTLIGLKMVAIARTKREKKKPNLTSLKQGTKSPTPLSNSRRSNQYNMIVVDEENPTTNNNKQQQTMKKTHNETTCRPSSRQLTTTSQ
jgi:hypothetical protein